MKKIVLVILIIFMPFLAFIVLAPPGEDDIDLVINGKSVETDAPVMVATIDAEDVLYVPAVIVAENLGFETGFNEGGKMLILSLGDFTVRLTVESRLVEVGGSREIWSVPVRVFEETVYMPAYAAAEALGALVDWDDDGRTLTIFTPPGFDPPPEEEAAEVPLLNVAYPPEGEPFFYYGESLFVFGTTQSFARVEVTVNGEPVELFDPRSGNFLTMSAIPRGEEVIIAVEAAGAGGTTRVERRVIYPLWWEEMPAEPLAIHSTRLVPADRQILKEGDSLQVAFQGSPGGEAFFQVGGDGAWQSMTERAYPGGPSGKGGIYTATYKVSGQDTPQTGLTAALPVTVSLRRGEEQVEQKLPGRVAFLADYPYRVVEIREEHQLKNRGWLYTYNSGRLQLLANTLGGSGYPSSVVSYLVEGTRFKAVGAFGDYYRVVIGSNENYLIHRDMTREPAGQALADAVLAGAELKETGKMVSLRLKCEERFPFFVDDGKKGLTIKMYGMTAGGALKAPELTASVKGLDLVPYRGEGTGPASAAVEVDFEMIGYKTRWDGTDLVVDLYKPGRVDRENPLRGKVIIVDPGHGGIDSGAPGPGDLDEKDVVLAISLYLKDMLTEAGAEVIMTRTEDIFVNLYDRPEKIDSYGADLFISVHANAHAADAPATEIHGLMMLYNYAHNEKLADIMLETMAKETDLPAFRTWRRNIAVLRHPHPPSVLVEAGYMMHPHDNWYLLHPRGQEELARAMMKGIANYFLATGR